MNLLKVLFGACFLFVAVQASSAAKEPVINMICSTEWPTTSFEVREKGDKVNVKLTHHNGVKYAPFHDSLITPNDITEMKSRADMISKLGDEWNFNFKRSDCKANSELFFNCMGDADVFEVNGIQVSPWALTMTDIEQKNMLGTYKQKNLSLAFKVFEKTLRITMNYDPSECVKIAP